jgi:hypothetical protein
MRSRSTMKIAVYAIALLAAWMLASPQAASAHTYKHGLTIFYKDQTLGPDDEVDGDLNVIFGDVTCDGASITGNVRTYGGTFNALDNCTVNGEQTDLGGSQIRSFVPWGDVGSGAGAYALEQNHRILSHFAYDLVIILVFLLFPVRVRIALDRVERHPGLSAGVGTLAVVAVLPIAVLLVLSIVGIPLIVLEIAALFAGLWIGQAAIAILVGRRLYEIMLPQTTPSPLGALVLGLVVVSAAELLPWFGWTITALVGLVGLGAAILAFVQESAFASFTQPPPPTQPAPGRPNIGGPPMRT